MSVEVTNRGRVVRHAGLCTVLLWFAACDWFTDMEEQPSIDPWQAYAMGVDSAGMDTIPFRGQPQFSVPVTGATVAGFEVSYMPTPATVDSMSGLANPVPASAASLANGRKHYAINCAVCHGDTGIGNGPATLYGLPGIALINEQARARSDGYLFGMIRNGRGLMPNYARIEEAERWDVVNYVRALQAQGGAGGQVETGQLAAPGVGGESVPGFTPLAPTRPAPHFRAGQESESSVMPSPAATSAAQGAADTTAVPAAPGTRAPTGASP